MADPVFNDRTYRLHALMEGQDDASSAPQWNPQPPPPTPSLWEMLSQTLAPAAKPFQALRDYFAQK